VAASARWSSVMAIDMRQRVTSIFPARPATARVRPVHA
jgi:hypothetical protein